jgi:NAD-dependent deacetylase
VQRAHRVLGRWARARPGFTLITQNVDGLHERAGSEDIVRLHGSIWHVRCADACAAGRVDWRDDRVPLPELPPRCPHCGALARPGVVWFGESLAPEDIARATSATRCDVFLTIGTSSIVYPAAGLVDMAKRHGATTIEINPQATPATARMDIAISGSAEIVLPEIDRRL